MWEVLETSSSYTYENEKGEVNRLDVGNKKSQHNNYRKQDVSKLQCQKKTEYCREPKQTNENGKGKVNNLMWGTKKDQHNTKTGK